VARLHGYTIKGEAAGSWCNRLTIPRAPGSHLAFHASRSNDVTLQRSNALTL